MMLRIYKKKKFNFLIQLQMKKFHYDIQAYWKLIVFLCIAIRMIDWIRLYLLLLLHLNLLNVLVTANYYR